MYVVVRNVPAPSFNQLGRAPKDCCPNCRSDQEEQTTIMPDNASPGTEQLTELNVGDALDGDWANRNLLGIVSRGYDNINRTKHEIYKLNNDTVRCRRMK